MECAEVPWVYAGVELQAVNVGEQGIKEVAAESVLLAIIEARAVDEITRRQLEDPDSHWLA